MSGVTGGDPQALFDVLLVEDDPGDVALVRDVFAARRLPYRLHVVGDGVEAMGFLRQQDRWRHAPRPQLVLLDLNMPRMDGRQVLAALKADPHLRISPVVVLTTSATDADVSGSYRAHANAYVTKPVDVHDFERVIDRIHRFYGELVRRPADPGRRDVPTGAA